MDADHTVQVLGGARYEYPHAHLFHSPQLGPQLTYCLVISLTLSGTVMIETAKSHAHILRDARELIVYRPFSFRKG